MAAHDFTVSGQGQFPLDMLRFEECWPTPLDADQMLHPGSRIIALASRRDSKWEPNAKRWKLLGWGLIAHEVK